MPTAPRLVYLNLPTSDLAAAKRFFGELGFTFDPRFTDEHAACMRVSDMAHVMLLTRERFADFTSRPTADAHATTEAIVCVSAEDRAGVDQLADAALAAGATSAQDPVDYGFMYGRSFHDLDGHHWEVMWMSAEPADVAPDELAAAS